MPNYDFKALSPIDFEELSRDLLQRELKIRFESFKAGKDGGIDLRYIKANKSSIIVQCKRYTNYKDLIGILKHELNKLSILRPKRYILCTTVPLSPFNKEEISNILSPYIKNNSDIYGQEDINNILGQNPDIERKHFKLWLSSSNILQTIINSKIYNQTYFEEEIINETVKKYVSNPSLEQAVQIIKNNNYVIISGIPGIGKSTLARILCYTFIKNGFDEFIYLTDSISEGTTLFNENSKQVFFFDDFLGSNFLESNISTNESKKIISFIEKINRSNNKILILTTREYILNQARQKHELLNKQQITLTKCTIDLTQYTKSIRARILYNHLFFSALPKEYIENIVSNKNYLKIIDHRNYNPRIIEVITTHNRWKSIKANEFTEMFINFLDYPESIWEHVYENQISPLSRSLLAVLMTTGTPILMDDLKDALYTLSERHKEYISNDINFIKSIKELEDTFIITKMDSFNNRVIEYQNPSVQDFLTKYLSTHKQTISTIIESSIFFNQLTHIFNFSQKDNESNKSKIILSQELEHSRLHKLIHNFNDLNYSTLRNIQYGNSNLFEWRRKNADLITKLYSLASLYSIYEYEDCNIFLKKEVERIASNIDYVNMDNYKYFIYLHNYYSSSIHIDKPAIIIELARSISSIYDIYMFFDIRQVNESDFIDAFNKEKRIINWIEETIEEDLSNADIDETDEVIHLLETISKELGINNRDKIDLFKERLEEHRFNPDRDSTNYSDVTYSNKAGNNDDIDTITNMFDSLKDSSM